MGEVDEGSKTLGAMIPSGDGAPELVLPRKGTLNLLAALVANNTLYEMSPCYFLF